MELSDFVGLVSDASSSYTREWKIRAKELEAERVYAHIAGFASIKPGELWIDFCCGTGNLVSHVASQHPVTAIMFDYNLPSILEAYRMLEAKGLPVNVNGKYDMMAERNPFRFKVLPKRVPDYRIKDGMINIFIDDLRELDVLGYYLNGRKADKITCSLRGAPSTSRYEGRNCLDQAGIQTLGTVTERDLLLHQELMNEFSKAAFNQAARFLSAQGEFIYADRVAFKNERRPTNCDMPELYRTIYGNDRLSHVDTRILRICPPANGRIREVSHTGEQASDMDLMISRFRL